MNITKNTSVAFAVSVAELTAFANRPVETYLVAAVVYFAICFSLSMLVRQLQKKIAIIR